MATKKLTKVVKDGHQITVAEGSNSMQRYLSQGYTQVGGTPTSPNGSVPTSLPTGQAVTLPPKTAQTASPATAPAAQPAPAATPAQASSGGLKNKGISTANPNAVANPNYINALYQEQYGRPATQLELAKFAGKTVKDAANLILGQGKSPFAGLVQQNQQQSAVRNEPVQQETTTQVPVSESTSTDPADYESGIMGMLNRGYDSVNDIAGALGIEPSVVSSFINDNYTAANLIQQNTLSNQLDEGYMEYRDKIAQLDAGIFELDPSEQAQINEVKRIFDEMRTEQITANKNYEGAITTGNIRSGMQEFMNSVATGIYKQAVDDGLKKVRDLELQAVAKVAELTEMFKEKKYSEVTQSYKLLNDYLTQKREAIKGIYDATKDYYSAQAEAQKTAMEQMFKYAEMDLNQAKFQLDNAKFDYTQKQDFIKNALENDKFDWQMKQDLLKYELDKSKFSYQVDKDAQDYQLNLQKYMLDVEKAKAQDTPGARAEYDAMGGAASGRSYDEFLLNKGRQSDKPATEYQSQSAQYAISAKTANDEFSNSLDDKFLKMNVIMQQGVDSLPQWAMTATQKEIRRAGNQFINAILRRESGAAVPDYEYARYAETYLPQARDSKEQLALKAKARVERIKSMAISAGSALDTEFVDSIGKTTYLNLRSYVESNPGGESYVKGVANKLKTVLGRNPTDDEVLQQINSSSGGGGFNGVGGDTKKAPAGLSSYAIPSPYTNAVAAKYPDGATGGQCGDFAHKLVNFPPVGDSKQSKINSVAKYGIPASQWKNNVKVGDVIITGENPTYGHVAVVNNILPDGRVQLTESNYKQSGKVSNDRKISINSPQIYGAIRGTLKINPYA